MNENVGIFRVTTNCDFQKNNTLGTAFAIKTSFGESNKYYLLTAYHVISELEAKGHPIIVKDEDGYSYNTIKVFPKDLSRKYREFGQDYALLEMYSDRKYQTYEIAITNGRLDCFVRGAIPHYTTVFTSIDGKILGEERIPNQKKVLQIWLNTSLIFDEQNKFIPEQKVLCGLSGAPILVEMKEEVVCAGVLGNLERDLRGTAKYAVPIKTIVEECLEPLHITYRLFNEKEKSNIEFYEEALIESVIGDTEDFLFSEEKLEQNAWNKLSNMFYKGIPVDIFLNNVIKGDVFLKYNSEVRCAIMYFYARLLFKRNQRTPAFNVFYNISDMLYTVSANTKIKLEALINSRSAIEKKVVLPNETLKAIRYAGDKVANLPGVTDDYVAYELASMYGRGLTNLFSVNMDYSYQEKEEIFKIFNEHKQLLKKKPVKLCKQDVVNTSLQWYIGFWGINKEFDLHSLSVAVNNGFSQSKKRKNSIFYIQSMISYAILSLLNNEKVRAVKTLLLSVKLILSEKVQLSHEGIKQLLFILKEKCVPLYAVVELAYTMQMEYGFYSKVALYDVDLGKMSWESIVDQVNELYMIRFKNKKIYNVDIEDVKIFL